MRRCVGCGKQVPDTYCRCGINKHLPRCPRCETGYWDRCKRTYIEEAAKAIYDQITDEIFREFGGNK